MIGEGGHHEAIPRFATGVPGLDTVVGGGLYEGSLYLIDGTPGAGKTLLSAQTAFDLADRGKNVIFLTLLAESHAKLIHNLSLMRFFRREHVGDRVVFLSGYRELLQGGHLALLELIGGVVREHRPYLVVIDGFRHFHAGGSEPELYTFVHELSALMLPARCTTLLLSPFCWGERWPEQALVDGFLSLTLGESGMRRIREIEVRKMRATDHLDGRHTFRISEEGLRIFPRLESTVGEHLAVAEERERFAFDIPRFDAMIEGGLLKGSTTSVVGSPGSGKTLLGLSFLAAGARRSESGLYFGFYESPDRLMAKAKGVGVDLQRAVDTAMLEILWQPPVERLLDELAYRLLEAVERRAVQRLFIDGVGGFLSSAAYPGRIGRFLAALTILLRARSVTTILTEELPLFSAEILTPVTELSAIVENVILMRQVELRSQLYRLISIMKLRESAYNSAIHEFTISARGIDVAPTFASAEAILTGHAKVPKPRAAGASRGRGRGRGR